MCGSDVHGPICYARHSDPSFVFTILFWDDLISLAFETFIALTSEKLVTWCILSPVNHTVISELILMKTYIRHNSVIKKEKKKLD